MNLGPLESIVFGIATLNVILLIALHIIGDIRTMIRRYKDTEPRRLGKRDRYQPTLSALVYHHDDTADINRCLGSLLANPYPFNNIIIVDTTNGRSARKKVSHYRSVHPSIPLEYRSFSNESVYRQQTGSVRSLLAGKLTLIIDSNTLIQSNSLLPAVRTFRDTQVVGIVSQTGLIPDRSMLQGVKTARQALINNFRRTFSGTRLFLQKETHPALLLRTNKVKRIIESNEGVLPLLVTHYQQSELYGSKAKLIWSADMQVWTDSLSYRAHSYAFAASMFIFTSAAMVLIYQLGLYNAAPFIVGLWFVVVIFAILSQSVASIYSRTDVISLALLAPFTVLVPLFSIYKKAKTH